MNSPARLQRKHLADARCVRPDQIDLQLVDVPVVQFYVRKDSDACVDAEVGGVRGGESVYHFPGLYYLVPTCTGDVYLGSAGRELREHFEGEGVAIEGDITQLLLLDSLSEE